MRISRNENSGVPPLSRDLQRGDVITAGLLNGIVSRLIRKITGGPGILVRVSEGRIVIQLSTSDRIAPPLTVWATIASEIGGGVYTWNRFGGVGTGETFPGPDDGEATEANQSTGIVAGTVVLLHRAGREGKWYFFFPVEEC